MGIETDRAFEVRERSTAGIPVLELAGALDYATVCPIELRLDALLDRGCKALIVDLSAATLVTSSVINVLFAAVRRLRLAEGDLAIVCNDPTVCKVLELTAFAQAASVCRTEEAALSALSARRAGC